jgi:hypothetical protein
VRTVFYFWRMEEGLGFGVGVDEIRYVRLSCVSNGLMEGEFWACAVS